MKKHHLIYSLLLLLITSVTSCEKAVFEEVTDTKAVTRSSTGFNDEYPGVFQNISTISLYPNRGIGIEKMTGEIYTYTEGVEYDFLLVSNVRGNIKCAVWAPGAVIIANGKNYSTIWGVNGQQIRFTIRLLKSSTQVHLALENAYNHNFFADGKARLVIEKRKCNGEVINNSPAGESYDLNVEARYYFSPDPGYDDVWICNQCGAINELNSSRCRVCR